MSVGSHMMTSIDAWLFILFIIILLFICVDNNWIFLVTEYSVFQLVWR